MKKYLILILLFLVTGCSSYIELNDLVIINAIGLAKQNNNYHLYISYVDEINKDTIEPTTTVKEMEGNSLNQIIDDLSLILSKKIYMSHLDLLVINDSIKTKELENIINYFLNNNETREDFLVINTDNIKDILEQTKFKEINDLIENNQRETSKTIYTTMYDVIENYYQKENIYLPYLTYNNSLTLKGLKVFSKNKYSLIEEDEVIYINYLLNKINSYKYSYECADDKFLYLNILGANVNELSKELLITNEIKVITNDCKLKQKEIEQIFNKNLKDNLEKITKKKLTIKNTIRGTYEN